MDRIQALYGKIRAIAGAAAFVVATAWLALSPSGAPSIDSLNAALTTLLDSGWAAIVAVFGAISAIKALRDLFVAGQELAVGEQNLRALGLRVELAQLAAKPKKK